MLFRPAEDLLETAAPPVATAAITGLPRKVNIARVRPNPKDAGFRQASRAILLKSGIALSYSS